MGLLKSLGEALSTTSNVLDAVAGFGSTVMAENDKINRIEADADLRKMQIDLNNFQKKWIQEFAGRSDFEKFEEDWDSALQVKYDEYNDWNFSDSYFKNNYTRRRGNEMFAQMKSSANAQIQQITQDKRIEHANLVDQDSINSLLQTASTKEDFVNIKKIYDLMYEQGRISESQYHTGVQQAVNQTALQNTNLVVDEYLGSNPQATMADVEEFLNNLNVEDMGTLGYVHQDYVYSTENGSKEIYFKADKAAIKDTVRKNTLQKIDDMQKRTNDQIHRTNTGILENVIFGKKPGSELIADIQAQIMAIRDTTDLQLTPENRRIRVKELLSVLETMGPDQEGTGGNGGPRTLGTALASIRSGSDYGGAEKPFDMELYIDAGRNGTDNALLGFDSMWTAYDAYEGSFYEYLSTLGYDEDTAELMMNSDFLKMAKNKLMEKYSDSSYQIDATFKNMQRLIDTAIPKKEEDPRYAEVVANCSIYLWDLIWDKDMATYSIEDVTEEMDKFIRVQTLKELDIQKNPKTLANDFNNNPDKALSSALYELSNNGVIEWTDGREQKHINEEALVNVRDNVIPQQLNIISSLLGYNRDDVKVYEDKVVEKDGRKLHDLDLMPSFETPDGKKIEFISKGKDDYELKITDRTGKVQTMDRKSIEEQRKNKKETNKFANDVNQENIKKENKRRREYERQVADEDINSKDAMATSQTPPPGVSQKEWDDANENNMVGWRGVRTGLMYKSEQEHPEDYAKWMKGDYKTREELSVENADEIKKLVNTNKAEFEAAGVKGEERIKQLIDMGATYEDMVKALSNWYGVYWQINNDEAIDIYDKYIKNKNY